MNYLRGVQVLVLGLGDSGLAMARWCARCGAGGVRVWDSRAAPPQAQALLASIPQAILLSGEIDADRASALLAEVQLVLKSPGLAPTDPRIEPLLAAAAARAIAVQVELDLFRQALADLAGSRAYHPRVLAITGTNGKTTTTAMTALLVERAGRRVAVAGNIGPTMLETLAAALAAVETDEAARAAQVDATAQVAARDSKTPVAEREAAADAAAATPGETDDPADGADEAERPRLPQVWVLELSSFQLDGVKGFEPSAAAVLNVTQDHLDWHGTMAAYAAAKSRVFGEHAVMVINRDDARVEAMVPPPLPPVAKALRGAARTAPAQVRKVTHFGLSEPLVAGDFGIVVDHGIAWLARATGAEVEESGKSGGRRRGEAAAAAMSGVQRLMPADALRVRGRHNAANAMAALALASAIDCPLAPMLHALRDYRGEPHRVEFVGAVGEVEAYDDSKGTNVGATVAALNGLGADRDPARLVVILGGDGKGQDFSPLREPVLRHVRAIATLGRDAAAIEAALIGVEMPQQRHDTLAAAVRWCFEQAQSGDAVLLSPACASLDMFRNYGHRAEVFVAAVRELAADRGEAVL
jgi:UDP-N-acetylmuramoylalanine--D-glutamate ligase